MVSQSVTVSACAHPQIIMGNLIARKLFCAFSIYATYTWVAS